jgi:DNA-binding transcriptional LysR family regulator
MTLEQLRIFVAVAERLHVTQAAAALHVTQSAASAAVQALEASTGTRLFDRVGRRIELTAAGGVLLGEARGVLARAEAAQAALDELAGLRRGSLRLWASQTIGAYFLPPLMHAFHAAHPGVSLHLAIGNTAQVEAAVLDGGADLGFVEGATESLLLVHTNVGKDELRLVAPPTLAGRPLADMPWVMREAGSGTRALHATALRDLGLDPAAIVPVLELPSNEAVLSAVLAGAGATILSGLVVDRDIAAGRLAALAGALPTRQFCALRHADRSRSAALGAFLDLAAGR